MKNFARQLEHFHQLRGTFHFDLVLLKTVVLTE
uniref:Uncharacterized protein n=1 Tax=Parascaris equorum TaxID=6256 RepID=A0A914R0M7_PAREQ